MKKLIGIFVVIATAGAGLWFFNQDDTETASPYRFVTIEQGDLEAIVSSTGNLEAVTTVQVGTQVSGIISQIYVDFNDKVYKGQIIARIDTTLLVSAVRDARANLQRSQAQLEYSARELERVKGLFEKQFVTEVEYNQSEYNYDIAIASVKSSEISLERALRNMSYATITAPISGVVVERNVDVGQTVAASFSAPQLFLIANDLSQMQILASVDESDIGRIEEGQNARFNVQAYDEEVFSGSVRQVRLQSTIQENVVNYTVVVDVNNEDGKLLPGMTATVDFLIETASDVFKIPNAGLRFRPTESMFATVREQMSGERGVGGDSSRQAGTERAGTSTSSARPAGISRNPNMSMLWYLDDDGQLTVARVTSGISDGSMTEISGEALREGLNIIAGVTQIESGGESGNPFQAQQAQRRPPGSF